MHTMYKGSSADQKWLRRVWAKLPLTELGCDTFYNQIANIRALARMLNSNGTFVPVRLNIENGILIQDF